MVIIDKRLTTQRLIVTVTENSSEAIAFSNVLSDWMEITPSFITDAAYSLTINSAFSNKSYSLNLPNNTSPFKDRYDEFLFDTTLITAWDNGFYNYQISEVGGSIVEVGTLEVIDGVTPTYISVTPQTNDEEFIIYKNSQE